MVEESAIARPSGLAVAEISVLSPTTAEALLLCPLKFAFMADPEFSRFRVTTPAAAVGIATHAILEQAVRGDFGQLNGLALRDELSSAWSAAIDEQREIMIHQQPLADVAPAGRWPNYAVSRARVLTTAIDLAGRGRGGGDGMEPPETERWVEAEALGLRGQVDRIEHRDGDTHVIDVKSAREYGEEIREQHRRQLLIYSAILSETDGKWPTRAAIELADGRRIWMDVHPDEARALLDELESLKTEYNKMVAASEEVTRLSRPGPETCIWCDYKGCCGPFFDKLDEDWDWWPVSAVGELTSIETSAGATSVALAVRRSNLPASVRDVRIIGLPSGVHLDGASVVAFVDADRSRVDGDLRVGVRTRMVVWQEEQG